MTSDLCIPRSVQFPKELADDMDTSEQDDRVGIVVRRDIESQDLMERESKELDANVRQTTKVMFGISENE